MGSSLTRQIQPYRGIQELRGLTGTNWTEVDLKAISPDGVSPARSLYVPNGGEGEGRLCYESDGNDYVLTGVEGAKSAMDGVFFADKILQTGEVRLALGYTYDDSETSYTEFQDSHNVGTATELVPTNETTSDLIYLGFDYPVTGVRYVSSVAGAGATIAVDIWTGSSFADPTDTDGTSALSQSGDITWAYNSSFAVSSINSSRPLFWVRISNSVVWSTNPQGYFQGIVTTDIDHLRVGY